MKYFRKFWEVCTLSLKDPWWKPCSGLIRKYLLGSFHLFLFKAVVIDNLKCSGTIVARCFQTYDVKAFHVVNQDMSFVSTGIADHFRNLAVFVIFNSNLQSISAEDLRPFSQLLVLDCGKNKLTNIDGDLFSFNLKLKWIWLSNNSIDHIGHDLVSHLNELKGLYFESNICTDRSASTRAAVLKLASQLSFLCRPLAFPPQLSYQPLTIKTRPVRA